MCKRTEPQPAVALRIGVRATITNGSGKMENIRKLQIQTLGLVVTPLAAGTAGYFFIESGWSVFDAFYMTAITITTVGFDEVQPLSTGGRAFSLSLIFFGLGSVAISATHLAQFIIQGELTGIFGRIRMQKQIDSLVGHYIVCGCGNIGSTICLKLFDMDLPFVVVESVPKALEGARGRGIRWCRQPGRRRSAAFCGHRARPWPYSVHPGRFHKQLHQPRSA
ncbi:MAG: potassium channel family protein [Humidesulfovibrio sp.]|nr:potassium channel family protein [Humidesulfovibrio sp.]